jgi:hypothetical protein
MGNLFHFIFNDLFSDGYSIYFMLAIAASIGTGIVYEIKDCIFKKED